MDKKFMNKLDDMEMDKVSGGVVPPVYVSRTPPDLTPPDFKAFEKQDKEKDIKTGKSLMHSQECV